MLILFVVLLRNMVVIKSFYGSWYKFFWIRWNGDLGGVYLILRCNFGRGMYFLFWKYGLWIILVGVGIYFLFFFIVK